MPLAKLTTIPIPDPAQAHPWPSATEMDGAANVRSPARLLQQRLDYQANALATPAVERWPIGRSVALIVASSIALWVAILEAGAALVNAIA